MPMSVEAAVITKKSTLLDFNTDSVNAAGKLWPREIVHSEKGIKAAGLCKEKPYYVLASSATKGTAESAADLFNSCADGFSADVENASELIADFFKAFSRVLVDSGYESSACDFSVFAGLGTSVYVGKCGKSRAYTYSDGKIMEIDSERHELYDGKSSYSVACCRDVKEGDIFILLTEKVAQALTFAVIAAICKTADGDIKKIAALILSQASKLGCTDAVSAVVLKIKEASVDAAPAEETPALSAEPSSAEILAEAAAVESESTEITEVSKDPEDSEVPEEPEEQEVPAETEKTDNRGKRAGVIILSVILAVLLLAITFFAVKIFSQLHADNRESTSDSDEQTDDESDDETDSESSSEEETESEIEEESSEEPATEESATEEESTTVRPVVNVPSTTRPSSTTTTRPAPTTTTTTTEPETESDTESESETQSEAESSETESSEENSSEESPSEEPSEETSGEDSTSEPSSSEDTPEE